MVTLHAQILLGPLEPGVGRIVEALVPEATHVEHQPRLYVAPAALTSPATAAATAADG
jgi:hypothetical protein